MSLDQPLFLWLAILAPLDLLITLRRLPRLSASVRALSGPKKAGEAGGRYVAASIYGAAASFLFVIMACLTLAGPSWGSRAVTGERSGLELALVIDVSRSMMVREGAMNRLDGAREAARSFLRALPGASFSLVAAKGKAILLVPMAEDVEAIDSGLDYADPETLSAIGTDLAEGIRGGLASFSSSSGSNRVILLLSDGGDQGGETREAAAEAKKRGVKIMALGLGGREALPVPGPTGEPLLDAQGRAVRSALQPSSLVTLAQTSGGRYLEASDPSATAALQAELTGLGKGGRRTEYQVEDRSDLFAVLALVFLLARLGASILALGGKRR